MIEISEALKAKYQDDISHKVNYIIKCYPSIEMNEADCFLTIGNDNLVMQSVHLVEGLWDGKEFELGATVSSQFEFDIADISKDLTGAYINVEQYLDDNSTDTLQIGKFIVMSVTKQKDRRIKKIKSFDYMSLCQDNGWSIYARLPSVGSETNTWGKITQQVADWVGVQVDLNSLGAMKDSYEHINYNKGNTNSSFSVRNLIGQLGAVLGGWFRFNRYGVLTLYRVGSPQSLETFDYGVSFDSEDDSFSGVDNIHYDTAYGTSYKRDVDINPDGISTISLNGNIFITASSDTEVLGQLNVIFNYIKDISFTPSSSIIEARPYLEVGDYYSFYDNGVLKTSLIARRDISGIQAQRDTFTSSANIYTNTDYDSVQSQVNAVSSTASSTAQTVYSGSGNAYITAVEKLNDNQISISVKDNSTGSTTTNIWNITTDSEGVETWKNTANNHQFTVKGW